MLLYLRIQIYIFKIKSNSLKLKIIMFSTGFCLHGLFHLTFQFEKNYPFSKVFFNQQIIWLQIPWKKFDANTHTRAHTLTLTHTHTHTHPHTHTHTHAHTHVRKLEICNLFFHISFFCFLWHFIVNSKMAKL